MRPVTKNPVLLKPQSTHHTRWLFCRCTQILRTKPQTKENHRTEDLGRLPGVTVRCPSTRLGEAPTLLLGLRTGLCLTPSGPDDTLCSASAYEPVNEGLGDNRATQAAFCVEELGSMKLLALHWTPSLGPST